jgi:hypothetical protein
VACAVGEIGGGLAGSERESSVRRALLNVAGPTGDACAGTLGQEEEKKKGSAEVDFQMCKRSCWLGCSLKLILLSPRLIKRLKAPGVSRTGV